MSDARAASDPRIRVLPPVIVRTAGEDAIDLAALAGLQLDDQQQQAVRDLLSERAPDRWAMLEGALVMPRQNGKGGVIEAIVLWALFIGRIPLTIYTAHELRTAAEMFRRIERLIRFCPVLHEQVKSYRHANGQEGIELLEEYGGARLLIIARSKAAGRGFSAPLVILDEAFAVTDAQTGALMPAVSAMANPLVLSFSSAGMAHSVYLHRLRRRALHNLPGRLCYIDYSVDPDQYGGRDSDQWREARADHALWHQANPALGTRILLETLEGLFDSLDAAQFDREYLGLFDPEPVEALASGVISIDAWLDLADPTTEPRDSAVAFVVDVAPNGRSAAIAMGALRADGRRHLQLIDHQPGTFWLEARRRDLEELYPDAVWAIDAAGPSVMLRSRDVWEELTAKDVGEAFAQLIAGIDDQQLRWRSTEELAEALLVAVHHAQPKVLGDGVIRWSRQLSAPADITPLVALTLAGWAGEYLAATGDPLKAIL